MGVAQQLVCLACAAVLVHSHQHTDSTLDMNGLLPENAQPDAHATAQDGKPGPGVPEIKSVNIRAELPASVPEITPVNPAEVVAPTAVPAEAHLQEQPGFIGNMGPYEPASEDPQPVLDWPYPYAKGFPSKGLLIAVVTAPSHVKARQAFRANWDTLRKTLPSQDVSGIDFKFFIGQLDPRLPEYNVTRINLEEESQQHGDIVRLNGFIENYRNLTLKTMNIVTWAHYQRYGGLFKVDDDTFLRLDNFLEFLKAEMNPRMIYAGFFVSEVRVITDPPTSKWFCDRYPYDVFPDYASGPGYFIGGAVMEFLVTNQNQLVDYQIEDASMGIWTQKMAGIDRVNLRVSAYVSYCEDGPDLIWTNPLEPDELQRTAEDVLHGDMCLHFQTPQACVKNPCLCTPVMEECNQNEDQNNGNAWHNFSTSPYQDNDARLFQLGVSTGLRGIRRPALYDEIKGAQTLT